jgi:predicted dinucleotide-binding enzyme
MQIGIVGAGYIGQAVARASLKAGHRVMLSNSRGARSLADLATEIGVEVGSVEEAVAFGDIVLVAVPLKNYPALPAAPFAGKIVIDTGNYYPRRDGAIAALDDQSTTTSELLARQLTGAKIVKGFNAILAAQIVSDAKAAGTPGRRALPIAGDNGNAKQTVTVFLDSIGFDVVDLGPLAEGWRVERARPAYCIPMDKIRLQATIEKTSRTDFVPEGSWRV